MKMKSNIVSDKRLPVPLQGLDLYPAPFTSPIVGTGGTCIPQDEVARHWPCVVKIINDYARELDLPDKIVYIFDQRVTNLILDFVLWVNDVIILRGRAVEAKVFFRISGGTKM